MIRVFVSMLLINFSPLCIGDVSAVERDWLGLDKRDSWMFYAGTGLLVIDAIQSHDISRHEDIVESNIILGEHPSNSDLNIYGAAVIGVNYTINRFMNRTIRTLWNTSLITVQIYAISNNYRLGVKLRL